MLAFYLLCPTAQAGAGAGMRARHSAQAAAASSDPDALYRQRENLDAARQAVAIWASRAAGGKDFESAWKLARACYWIGTHGTEAERRAALEQGVKAGEQAAAIEPARPNGHFWTAANMGALAESYGLRQGLKYRGRIKDALETVLKIDPAWQQGSADRALGRWYFKVPGLFGGSDAKAEEHLRKALAHNPESTATLYFLAEVLLDRGKKADARAMLERAIAAPLDPEWAPEDRAFQEQARVLLEKIKTTQN
ncbi:MAG TPA: TRAP transporter TatT component family protein [Vicinamibacterales bacterium]|nr:TRAP transporter TatT component family protein [Vicinamibacterales bacterium]